MRYRSIYAHAAFLQMKTPVETPVETYECKTICNLPQGPFDLVKSFLLPTYITLLNIALCVRFGGSRAFGSVTYCKCAITCNCGCKCSNVCLCCNCRFICICEENYFNDDSKCDCHTICDCKCYCGERCICMHCECKYVCKCQSKNKCDAYIFRLQDVVLDMPIDQITSILPVRSTPSDCMIYALSTRHMSLDEAMRVIKKYWFGCFCNVGMIRRCHDMLITCLTTSDSHTHNRNWELALLPSCREHGCTCNGKSCGGRTFCIDASNYGLGDTLLGETISNAKF